MQMPIDRRSLIGAGLGLSLASVAGAQEWGTPTPAEGEPDRPAWPPEHFKLWPGKAPGAPAPLPPPRDTMNGPAGDHQLWLYGLAEPNVEVHCPPHPDARALLSLQGGGYSLRTLEPRVWNECV